MARGLLSVVQREGAVGVPGLPALVGVDAAHQVLEAVVPGDAALGQPGVAETGGQAEAEMRGKTRRNDDRLRLRARGRNREHRAQCRDETTTPPHGTCRTITHEPWRVLRNRTRGRATQRNATAS